MIVNRTLIALSVAIIISGVAYAAPPPGATQDAVEMPHGNIVLKNALGVMVGQATRYASESEVHLWYDLNGNGKVEAPIEFLNGWAIHYPGPYYVFQHLALVFIDEDGDGTPDAWAMWEDTDGDGTHETLKNFGSCA